MRARSLVLATVLGLAACGSRCGSDSPRDAATALAPATLPTEALALVATDDAKVLLDGLRAQFRDRATAFPLPADAREVLAGVAPLPEPLLRHVAADAPLRTLYLRDGEVIRRAIATRVQLESNPQGPLGLGTELLQGGPDGSRWVNQVPSGSDVAVALYGTTLVVAENERVLRAAGRYLDSVAIREPSGEGASIHVYGRAFEGPLRGSIEAVLEEQATAAIDAARAERARHSEGAFFGEPDRFVELLRDQARHYLAYLPDVASMDLRVLAGASGVTIEGSAAVEQGSPLARALASVDVGVPFGFESLPVGTALAVATRRARGETPLVDLVRPVAGARLPAADVATFTTAADTLATMRGDASVLALGGHADGAFLFFATSPGATPLDSDVLERPLGTTYLRQVLGGVVGCDQVPAPSLGSGRSRICRIPNGPEPVLELERGPNANALTLSVRPTGSTERHGAARGVVDAASASQTLFREPDAVRALGVLGDRTFLAIALSPRGVVPSLGLLDSARLRTLAASRALPTTAAPLVLGLSRDEDGSLGVRAAAPPRALEESYALAMLAMLLMSGG